MSGRAGVGFLCGQSRWLTKLRAVQHLGLLALFAMGTSGCLQYVLVMGNPSQKAAAYNQVIGEAVGDAPAKKDCPRWIAGINSIRDKLPIVAGNNPTWYGKEIEKAYHACTFKTLKDLEAGKDGELERSKRAVESFDQILSMPLAPLKIKDYEVGSMHVRRTMPGTDSLRALRAKTAEHVVALEKARAKLVAQQTKRMELGNTAEKSGWPLAALVAWMAVQPLDDATKAAQDAAIRRLAGPAQAALAAPVALVAAAADGAKPAVVEQVRTTSTLASKPTLRVVEAKDSSAVRVELAVGKSSQKVQKSKVNSQHTYVSGSKMVPNPEIAKLQKEIAQREKDAEWNRKGAETACKGQKGRCQTREIRYKEAERHRAKAQKARQDLARAKPMVRQDIKSRYDYTADKTSYVLTAPVSVSVLVPGSKQPTKQAGTAKVERSTITFAGNRKVGLAGRNDAPPTAAEMEVALEAEAVRLLAMGAAVAPAQLAGQHDAEAAAATEPLAKLHFALIKAIRSGAKADIQAAEALLQPLLETKVDGAKLMRTLSSAKPK